MNIPGQGHQLNGQFFPPDAVLPSRGQFVVPYASVPGEAPSLIPVSSATSMSSSGVPLDRRWWSSQPGGDVPMNSFRPSGDQPSAFYRYAPTTAAQPAPVGFVGTYAGPAMHGAVYSVPHHPHTPYILGAGDRRVSSAAVPVFASPSPSLSSARRSSRSSSINSIASADGSSAAGGSGRSPDRASLLSNASSQSSALRKQLMNPGQRKRHCSVSSVEDTVTGNHAQHETLTCDHANAEVNVERNYYQDETGGEGEDDQGLYDDDDGDDDGGSEEMEGEESREMEGVESQEMGGDNSQEMEGEDSQEADNILLPSGDDDMNAGSEEEEPCAVDSDESMPSSASSMPDPRIGYGLEFIPSTMKQPLVGRNATKRMNMKPTSTKRTLSRPSGRPRKRACVTVMREPSPSDDESEESSLESDSESVSESNSGSDSESDEGSSVESSSMAESESSEESDSESDSSDSSDGPGPQWRGRQQPGHLGRRRGQIVNEADIQLPLEFGWKRQTKLRPIAQGGIRGDVYYYAPCGKKIRTYPEVSKYLTRNNIENLGIKNFSFSTKLNVGDFVEARPGGGVLILSSEEVKRRQLVEDQRKQQRVNRLAKKREKKRAAQAAAEERFRRKLQRQKEVREAKAQRREKARLAAMKRKQERALVKEKAKKQQQQEKRMRREQVRQEKLLRAQQAEVARQRRREEAALQKQEEAIKKQQEREHRRQQQLEEKEKRRQQALLEKEVRRQEHLHAKAQERERRRLEVQHLRAREAQKKAEEREKLREEKRLARLRKMEEKRRAIELARQLRRPREDLLLDDAKPLPELPKIECELPDVFGNLLMVDEFLHSFGDLLEMDFDEDGPPTVKELLMLVSCDEAAAHFATLCCQLLAAALSDSSCSADLSLTLLGTPLSSIDIGGPCLSEVLRLYMADKREQAPEVEKLIPLLEKHPLSSLCPALKVEVLKFLVNELLMSETVCRQVEGQMELSFDLKRDKSKVEQRLRKLRLLLARRWGDRRRGRKPSLARQSGAREGMKESSSQDKSCIESGDQGDNSEEAERAAEEEEQVAGEEDDDEDEDYEDEEEEDDEGDDGDEVGSNGSENEESDIDMRELESEAMPDSKEVTEQQIAKYSKWQQRLRNRLHSTMKNVRISCCGRDRYYRTYWALPSQSGIYVEGINIDPVVNVILTRIPQPVASVDQPSSLPKGETTPPGKSGRGRGFLDDERRRLEAQLLAWAEEDRQAEKIKEEERSEQTLRAPHVSDWQRPQRWFSLLPRTSCCNGKVMPEIIKKEAPQLLSSMQLSARSSDPVSGGMSPQISVVTPSSPKPPPVPDHLRETDDVHLLRPELIHGWRHISSAKQVKDLCEALHFQGQREQGLQKYLQKNTDALFPDDASAEEELPDCMATLGGSDEPLTSEVVCAEAKRRLLDALDALTKQLCNANLQRSGCKTPNWRDDHGTAVIVRARQHLLQLEELVERRYLKTPFKDQKVGKNSDDSSMDNNVPEALARWRSSVSEASSFSQLHVLMWQLSKCLAWEKSIMKVFCQVCRKGDNEELLLLCDECENGYHTYCCTPKLSDVPDGDWFCRDCTLMAKRGNQCVVCSGSGTGYVACCAQCDKVYHISCLSPPLTKVPRQAWHCPACKKLAKSRRDEEQKDSNRRKNQNQLAVCRSLLCEMEKHDCGWPFLVPVSRKQVPEYRNIIKNPMDFQTMKNKLRENNYTCRQDFAADVRLIFDNCQTFNEDDSEVGQAGFAMREFFECRWKELFPA